MIKNLKFVGIFIPFLLTGCFLTEPHKTTTNTVNLNVNMNQENNYIRNKINNMFKMVYENNFIQQKIADNIDDLGEYTINSYDNTENKAVKIPYDDIDRLSQNFIKIYNSQKIIKFYKLSLVDYDNNIENLNIRDNMPILCYYIVSKITGIGKLVRKNVAMKYAKNKNIILYKITYKTHNGLLYVAKYNKITGKFENKSKINLNKIQNYINNIDNIVVTIKKKKGIK